MMLTAEMLQHVHAFAGLDHEQLRRVAQTTRLKRFLSDQLLISQEDESKEVFFIVSGRVRARMFSANGKEVSYQDLGPGDMFGELAAIDGGPRATYVVAISDVEVVSMSCEVFWQTLRDFPSVNDYVLNRLVGLVRMHCERIFEFSTLGVKNRIHAELLRLAREQDGSSNTVVIENPPTHVEIASRVSTHREAVTRECKHLESLGVIEWRRGSHVIKDVSKLERMVKEVRGH